MRINTSFLLTLLLVFLISTPAPAQQEEITLSTYYPAPYGEYEEMAAENLFVDKQIIGNMDVNGDGQDSTHDDIALVNGGNLLVEGRVGIGTTGPNTALDLNGAFSIRGLPVPAAAPAGQGRIYFDSTANRFRVSENGGAYADLATAGAGGALWALTATGNNIYNTNTGNVGINGPTKIQGGNLALLDASTTATSSGPSILLGTTPVFQKSSSYSGIHRRVISGTTCTQFTSGTADVMVLTDAGNVGIGTTNPTNGKLEVAGEISTGAVGIRWKRYTFSISNTTGNWTDSGANVDITTSKIVSITGALNDASNNRIAIGPGTGGERWGALVNSAGDIVFTNNVAGWTGTNNAQILVFYED